MTKRRSLFSGIGLRAWRRQLGHDRSALLAIAVATLSASVFVAMAPRVAEHASAGDLRTAVAEATPEQRNLRFRLRTRLGARLDIESFDEHHDHPVDDDPASEFFSYVERRGDQLLGRDLPESVRSIISDEQWVFDSPTFKVSSYPDQVEGPNPTTFRFRAQDGLDDQMTLVRGRLPGTPESEFRTEGSECPDRIDFGTFEPEPEQDCQVVELQVFETALTEQTAADMMVDVGDIVTLTPDPSDTKWLTASFPAFDHRLVLRISGIVELTDPNLEYWYADSSLHRARITDLPPPSSVRLVFAVGTMRPDRYRQFLRAHPDVQNDYTWRYLVDPDLMTGDNAEPLAIDLEKIQPSEGEMFTLLPNVLRQHLLQRTLAIQLLSMGTAGLGLVALVTVAALGLLSAVRRRASTALIVDRGASRAQMTINATGTGLVTGVPAALIGWLIAWRLLPATASRASSLLVALLAALVVAVFVGSTVPQGVRSVGTEGARSSRAQRWLVEGVIVGLALASLALLRRRGSVALRTTAGDLDLLLAVTPALLALAAGIVAVRVIGPIVATVARLGRRTRGVGIFVGLRRLVSQPPSMRFPVVVVTVAAALVAFSSVLSTSVTEAQIAVSWQTVGGDFRVESSNPGSPLPLALDPDTFGTGRDAVGGVRFDRRRVAGDDGAVAVVDVVAVEVDAYRTLLDHAGRSSGSLGKIDESEAIADSAPTDAESTVRAIRVGDWPARAGWSIGSTVTVSFGSATRDVRIVGADDRMVGVAGDQAALVIDRSALAASIDGRTAQPTFFLLDGDKADGDRIAEVVEDLGVTARVVARTDRLDTVAGDPLSRWTDRSLNSLAGFGLLFSLIAVVSAAVIGDAVRRRDLAVLRTLGLRSREAGVMTVIEHVPFVVGAVLVGTGCGIATAYLMEPALGLDAFAGGSTPVVVTVDWLAIAAFAATLVLGMAIVLAASIRALGRAGGAKMLNVGDQ